MIRHALTKLQKEFLLLSGLVLFILVPVWVYVAVPLILRLPNDFTYQIDLVSFDNFYDSDNHQFTGKTQSASNFKFQVKDVQPAILNLANEFRVKTSAGDTIVDIVRNYGIDPLTRQHVIGYGDHDRSGYLFGPRNAKAGQNFIYWHVNYDQPIEMHYIGKEQLYSLEVYHYRSSFTVDQTVELGDVPNVGETLGMNTNAVLDLWIEPTTGWLVKYSDTGIVYYYDLANHERIQPWNKYSNTSDDGSVVEQVTQAQQERDLQQLIQTFVPWTLVMLALFCAVPYGMGRFQRVDHIVRRFAPLAVSVTGITITIVLTIVSYRINEHNALFIYRNHVSQVIDQIQSQFDAYQLALRASRNLLSTSDDIDPAYWSNYVDDLRSETKYAAIHNMGYARAISVADETVALPIIYLQPNDSREQIVQGKDFSSMSEVQTTLEQARDTGAVMMSTKFDMSNVLNHKPQAAVFLVIPKYKQPDLYTVAERREQLQGYLFSSVLLDDFMNAIVADDTKNIPFAVFEQTTKSDIPSAANLLYQQPSYVLAPSNITDVSARSVVLYGQRWQFHFQRSARWQYLSTVDRTRPWIILVGGICLSLFSGALFYYAERGYLLPKQP